MLHLTIILVKMGNVCERLVINEILSVNLLCTWIIPQRKNFVTYNTGHYIDLIPSQNLRKGPICLANLIAEFLSVNNLATLFSIL